MTEKIIITLLIVMCAVLYRVGYNRGYDSHTESVNRSNYMLGFQSGVFWTEDTGTKKHWHESYTNVADSNFTDWTNWVGKFTSTKETKVN